MLVDKITALPDPETDHWHQAEKLVNTNEHSHIHATRSATCIVDLMRLFLLAIEHGEIPTVASLRVLFELAHPGTPT